MKTTLLTCLGCKKKFLSSGEGCCSNQCKEKHERFMPFFLKNKLSKKRRVRLKKRISKDGKLLQRNPRKAKRSENSVEKIQRNSHRFYDSREWQELRYYVIRTYGRECMACGKTSGELHVDHIFPRSKYPKLEMEFNNLQILCRDCNLGKGCSDSKDWRPEWAKKSYPNTLDCNATLK